MNEDIQAVLARYPPHAISQFISVRQLIFLLANENELSPVEETLKWGEPSYKVKSGSAIRIDWKAKDPNFIKVYFHCQTILLETFKELYPKDFMYEGNRAIAIPLTSMIEHTPLRHCLTLALQYHTLKHQPLLGA
ncbi:DUF1801 domain-containing protein [uncultured Paraglaciecola sp.]|uniref:DUF1801 domain-containing protein n=1 Tax=uncultured Paraglaciecola sp. TaxID=1765024 RepID=UPI0030DD8D35|tara:strand:- start:2339 stop:2743 length:405 start_codon:yes stop_codon:yes gene_type:complete